MYDVVVVGARCAGSPTAMLLARKGYRVLLVDRATFPSDTMSTHYIHQTGVAQLKRWGLLDKVVASGCPPIAKATFDFGSFALASFGTLADGVAEGYCPRRTVLDTILVNAAVEAGVELRQGFVVQELCTDGERVTGVRGRIGSGSTVTEKGCIVIGADGMNSIVARTVKALEYYTKPTLACYYSTYWSGVPLDGAEVYLRDHRIVIALPTNDSLACIVSGWPHKEFHRVRIDIEGNYLKTLELAPGLAERVRGGKREERFVGTANLPNFFRKPYGPGWALVGDAGYHKDPITAQGIKDAFRDAELLAEAIDAGLSERQPLNEALSNYELQRNKAAMLMYQLTCQRATLKPPRPYMQQFFAALQANQTESNRFWGVDAGTVPVQDFYSPENIQRIVNQPSRETSR